MSALSSEAKAEIRRYLASRVIALIGLFGIGAVGSIYFAVEKSAKATAERVSASPAPIAEALLQQKGFLEKIGSLTLDVPTGTIVPYAGELDSAAKVRLESLGWLPCNGEPLSRTEYSELFEAIGTAWGAPGEKTFSLPDLRGRFLRGVDEGSGRDVNSGTRNVSGPDGNAGDKVGSIQGDATRIPTELFIVSSEGEHSHSVSGGSWHTSGPFSGSFPSGSEHGLARPSVGTDGDHSHKITGGDRETRPKNANVFWLIRFGSRMAES